MIANAISTDWNGRLGRDIQAASELMKELDERFYRDHVRSPASVLKPENGTLVFELPGIRGTLVWRKLEPWWFADANLDVEADEKDGSSTEAERRTANEGPRVV